MAYGNVIGYEPAAQPGAYRFKQANGGDVLLAGLPAENLKARLDASAGLAGQKVAGPGGGAPADSPAPLMSVAPPQDAAPAMSVAPPPPSPEEQSAAMARNNLAPPPPPPAPGPQFRVTPEASASEGVPSALAAPAPPPHSEPVMVNGVNTGYVKGPDGRLYQHVAGSAGVTQAQLAAKAGTGVAMPTSMSESVTGGFAPSQDYLDERHRLAEDKQVLIDKTADVEKANAEREQALAQQQFADAAALKAAEQARTDAVQARLAKDETTKDQLMKEYGNAKVDPTRIFSGASGAARGVMFAIGSALGTLGAGLQQVGGRPGSPNIAFQALNSAIDRDIAAQENEIKVKGQMADNALAQFQRTGLTLDQSRAALRMAQLGWAQAQTNQSAALTKGSMVDVNAEGLRNQLSSAMNDADEQYRQHSLGTATKAVAEAVMYPHAGSAGGMQAVTPGKTLEVIKSGQELEHTGAETAKLLGEVGKSGGPKGQNAANIESVLATTATTLDRLGKYKPDEVAPLPENQNVVSRAFHSAVDAVGGAGTSARNLLSSHDRALIQDTEEARSEIRSLNSVLGGQGALSAPEAAEANKGLAPGATVGEIMRAQAMLRERANAIQQVETNK